MNSVKSGEYYRVDKVGYEAYTAEQGKPDVLWDEIVFVDRVRKSDEGDVAFIFNKQFHNWFIPVRFLLPYAEVKDYE